MLCVDKDIKKMADSVISPFDLSNVGCISYDLSIDGFVGEGGNLVYDEYVLRPNEMVMVKTKETLRVPGDLAGIIGEKNSRMRQGLFVSGPRYFPGHKTAVYLRVVNLSPVVIKLNSGEKIAQIFFEKLTGVPETPYNKDSTASFNDESQYAGFGRYKSLYEGEMEKI